MSEVLGTSGNDLTITIPSSGDTDWSISIRDNCFQVISDHKHEGSGVGAKIRGYLGFDFTEALYPNATAILARNAAGNGTVTVMTVNASDEVTYTGAAHLFDDDVFKVVDQADDTKEIIFSVGGATTGAIATIISSHTAARSLTLPDATDTLVGKATTDTLTNKTHTDPVLNGTLTGTAFLDEDAMGSDSAIAVASQQSIKAYVDAAVGASDLDIAGDTGTDAIDLDSEVLTFTGGTGIDTAVTTDTITFSVDATVATASSSTTFTNKTLTSPVINTGVSGTAILDEDNLVSDSDTQLATQQSIKAYVDAHLTATANETTVSGSIVGIADNAVMPGTNAIVLPTGTTVQGTGTTNGSLRFNSTLNRFEGYKNSAFSEIGGGSAGDADTIHLLNADGAAAISDLDLSGNNAAFDGGGTITASSLTLSTTAADLVTGTSKVFSYVPAADGSDDYFGITYAIPKGLRGRTLGFSFEYKNDSTVADDDFRFCVKQKDGTNAGDIAYYNMSAYNTTNGNSGKFPISSPIFGDCTEIEIGWQNTSATTTVELHVDKLLVSSTPEVGINLAELGWTAYTPTFTGFGTVSEIEFWYRIQDENYEVRGHANCGTSTGVEARISLPNSATAVGTFTNNMNVGTFVRNVVNTNDVIILAQGGEAYVKCGIRNNASNAPLTALNGNGFMTAGNRFVVKFSLPVNVLSIDTHVVTPAKSNMSNPATSTASINWTTNTTHTVNEHRVGQFLHLEGNIVLAGAPDSATLTITLPETIDTSVFDTSTDNSIGGTFDYVDGGVRVTHAGKIRYASSTTMIFTINDTDLTQASPITWASTDEINYRIKVPISGWTSDVTFLAAIPYKRIAILKDEQTTGTDGGTFTSGSWVTRVLNTLESDTSFVSLATNQFTLTAGKYYISASAPAYDVNTHKTRLQNITDTATTVVGTTEYIDVQNFQTRSFIEHVFTITASKTFELQHQCQTTAVTAGLGNQSVGFSAVETYAIVTIEKIK
jgi:hypothetical protein